jgi:hypothetical protein
MERRAVKSSLRSEPDSEPHSAVVWEWYTGGGFPASWQSLHGPDPQALISDLRMFEG